MGIFSFSKKESKKSSGFFVPKGTGFEELKTLQNVSLNDVSNQLGYNPDMVHTYINFDFGGPKVIHAVVFEIFTSKIIFVSTINEIDRLSRSDVDRYLKNFDVEEVFDPLTTEGIFEDGISNKSLSSEYLSRTLGLNDIVQNGVLSSDRLGLHLYFINGILTDIQTSDGLNQWAKDWKKLNPEFIEGYQKEAEHYWGKSQTREILREINAQAEAWADLPFPDKNPYCDLHKSIFGNVNYVNVLMAHYQKDISLSEFLNLNKGRYKEVSKKQYNVGNFLFGFDENGMFLNASQLK